MRLHAPPGGNLAFQHRQSEIYATDTPSAHDGSLAEGALDLAFRDETADFNGWTVVDFKTDQEFAKESDDYKTQVRFYARAVQAATGLPARGIVLVV